MADPTANATAQATTARRYINITRSEFESALSDMGDFERVEYDWTQEHVYEMRVRNVFIVRVYSSVDKRSDDTRSCGKDAIRVCLLYDKPGEDSGVEPLAKQPHTKRMPNWVSNLTPKVESLLANVPGNIHGCDNCGSMMVIRTNGSTGEDFYSCLGCRNTEDY